MPVKIESIDHLKERCLDGWKDFFICLCGPLRSSKEILFDKDKGTFHIFNGIDGTHQTLTEDELRGAEHSLISEAIQKGTFYMDD